MRAIILYFRFFVLFAICSCSGTVATKEITVAGDTLRMRHSSLLQIVDYDGYCVVDVKNPWEKDVLLHSYMLLHKDSCDVPLSREMTVIRTPIDNQLVFATLHAQLIVTLGRADAISGVCDAR